MFNLIGLLLLVAAYLTTLGPTLTILKEYVNIMADNKRSTEKLLDHLNVLNAQSLPLFYCLHIIGTVLFRARILAREEFEGSGYFQPKLAGTVFRNLLGKP